MALGLVGRGVRALSDHVNKFYRVLKGIDADSVTIKLPAAGAFTVKDEADATLFSVSEAGTGTISGLGLVGGKQTGCGRSRDHPDAAGLRHAL
jgi:hypothetical protein